MEFHDGQWYKGRNRHPVRGWYIKDEDHPSYNKVNWVELGVHTLLPRWDDFGDFASHVAYLDSPMTEQQVQIYAQKMKEHYEKQRNEK